MHAGAIVREGTPAQLGEQHPATVRFEGTEVLQGLGDLPGSTRVVTEHRTTTVETRDLQATLTALLVHAAARDLRLTGLEARAASLEHVFLSVAEGASR
jgi:ABC-2 type transport system ATP-binding protein